MYSIVKFKGDMVECTYTDWESERWAARWLTLVGYVWDGKRYVRGDESAVIVKEGK